MLLESGTVTRIPLPTTGWMGEEGMLVSWDMGIGEAGFSFSLFYYKKKEEGRTYNIV